MANKIWLGNDSGNEGKWATAANWSPAGVPVNADDVYLENSSQDVTADFDQSAVTLDSLTIAQSYTGEIGDADNYLKIGATVVNIGQHYGPGSPTGPGRVKLDLGAAASTVTIYNTGASVDTNKPCVRILCNHANTKVRVRKGTVGIAFETGETSTLSSIAVSYVNQKATDADVFIGPGVTLTTFNKTGGDATLECAATTVNNDAGDMVTAGSGAIATMNVRAGIVIPNSTGTITALNVIEAGFADFTKSAAPRTVTTAKIGDNGKIKYDPSIVTMTNKIQPYDSSGEVTIQAA